MPRIVERAARDLVAGDRVQPVLGVVRTVDWVHVEDRSLDNDGEPWSMPTGPTGVTVHWENGQRTGYRLDAVVDVWEPDPAVIRSLLDDVHGGDGSVVSELRRIAAEPDTEPELRADLAAAAERLAAMFDDLDASLRAVEEAEQGG